MPVAIPLIMAGTSIGSSLIASHNAKKANAGMAGMQQQSMAQSGKLFDVGYPLLKGAGSYYDKVLTGDKSTLTSAISPEINATTEAYRGASRNLTRQAPGAGRDLAYETLNRQKVGQIAGLFPAARRAGVEGAAQIGQAATGASNAAANTSVNLFSSLLARDRFNAEQSGAFGEALGPLFVDLYKAWQKKPTSGPTAAKLPNWGLPISTTPIPDLFPKTT